jgi:hypothetical protein
VKGLSIAELFTLLGITATAAEINKLASLATTAAELVNVHLVTAPIQTQLDDKKPIEKFSRMTVLESDLMGVLAYCVAPLSASAVVSGTWAFITGSIANHPGIVTLKSSTSANSGMVIFGSDATTNNLISGGETYEVVFQVVTTAGTTVRLGYHDTPTVTEPTDGVWFSVIETTLAGYAKNNAGPTVTGTTYTVTTGVWYRAKIVLNADATLATFTLYTCADGVAVWTDTVNANIPTGTGRQTDTNMIATNSGTGTVLNLLHLDWFQYACSRVLVR